MAFIAGMLAEEIGLNGALARRCGLLHDIGKAADHEAEGGHPKIGADLLKRYGERPEVVHAAAGHHDDLRIDNPYTVLVSAADACSASRPGARRETLERYVKRMEELESIAGRFPGVEQAFAIQAGRELRVMVSSKETTDETAAKICRDIVKAFEQQLTYPGEIKVTVLRESRYTELAQVSVLTVRSEKVGGSDAEVPFHRDAEPNPYESPSSTLLGDAATTEKAAARGLGLVTTSFVLRRAYRSVSDGDRYDGRCLCAKERARVSYRKGIFLSIILAPLIALFLDKWVARCDGCEKKNSRNRNHCCTETSPGRVLAGKLFSAHQVRFVASRAWKTIIVASQ